MRDDPYVSLESASKGGRGGQTENRAMSEPEKPPEEVLDLFGDAHVRRILLLTSDAPMSATALADELDVSRPTVYRRVNILVEYGLLREHVEVNLDGHHYRTFETVVNEITFSIRDGRFGVTVGMEESLVDRFDGFLGGLEAAYSPPNVGTDERPETSSSGSDPHYG